MVVYCTALGLRRGHLVYAEGPQCPMAHEVRHSGVQVVRHALDLAQPPRSLLSAVDRIAAELARDAKSVAAGSSLSTTAPRRRSP